MSSEQKMRVELTDDGELITIPEGDYLPDEAESDAEELLSEKPKRKEKPKGLPADFYADAKLAAMYGLPVLAVLGLVFVIVKIVNGIQQQMIVSEVTPMKLSAEMGPMNDLVAACAPPIMMAVIIAIALQTAAYILKQIIK